MSLRVLAMSGMYRFIFPPFAVMICGGGKLLAVVVVARRESVMEGSLLTCGVGYRAFADFVLGSLILHFFCVNFIN